MILTWSKNCVITSKATRDADPDADPAVNAVNNRTDTKLYVSAVTLSTEDDNKFLEELKTGFRRPFKWNKYRSEKSNQTKTNNLNYLIDPTLSQ